MRPHVAAVGLKVPPSLIVKLEQGRVPNWPLLIAYSKVLDEPLDALVARLVPALSLPTGERLMNDVHDSSAAVPPGPTPASHASSQAHDHHKADPVHETDHAETSTAELRRAMLQIASIAVDILGGHVPPGVPGDRDNHERASGTRSAEAISAVRTGSHR
jgi:hypothetical protein